MADENRLTDWVDEGNQDAFERFARANRRGVKAEPRTIPLATGVGNVLRVGNKLLTDPAVGKDLINRLTGEVGGEERMTTWPERMARGVHGLAKDVSSGDFGTVRPDAAGMVSDEAITQRQQRDFQEVQDLSNAVIGGSVASTAVRGPMKNALGTGAVPKDSWLVKSMNDELKGKDFGKPPAPIFYSGVENALEHSTQALATPDQWLGTLKNARGVKPEEMQWLGIEDFLAEKRAAGEKVSRAELQEFVKNNKIDVKEVKKTKANEEINDDTPEYHERDMDASEEHATEALAKEYKNDPELKKEFKTFDDYLESDKGLDRHGDLTYDWLDAYGEPINEFVSGPNSTKYSDYQLPGGRDYGELLLTLPHRREAVGVNTEGDLAGVSFTQRYRGGQKSKEDYTSSHWDEPNVLAHVRYNTREIPSNAIDPRYKEIGDRIEKNGVETITPEERELYNKLDATGGRKINKTLHLEEIQSDWHQAGKKKGYKTASQKDIDAAQEKMTRASDEYRNHLASKSRDMTPQDIDNAIAAGRSGQISSWVLGDPKNEHFATDFIDAVKHYHDVSQTSGVPDAPFKKSWPELAFKRMLRHAAENGYDAISWTPGEAQAARYDLSKKVEIDYRPKADGKYWLNIRDKNTGHQIQEKTVSEKELADLIGKDAAEKVVKGEGDARYEPSHESIRKRGNPTGVKQEGSSWYVTFKDDQKLGTYPTKESAEREAARIKEMAAEVGSKTLKGDDLKVGGEGMKRFYDDQLVAIANKYTKAHGGKVEQKPLGNTLEITERKAPPLGEYPYLVDDPHNPDFEGAGFWTRKEAENYVKHNTPAIHYMELPKTLSDTALSKGFPLFSHGVMLTPVEDNPFEQKKAKP